MLFINRKKSLKTEKYSIKKNTLEFNIMLIITVIFSEDLFPKALQITVGLH